MSIALPIEEDPRFRRYTASQGQKVFSVPFPFQQDEDLSIQLLIDGVYSEIDRSLFAISGAMDPQGGSVTFHSGRSAGEVILVVGIAVLERLSSVVRDGRFASKLTDDELDRNRIIQQEQAREARRAIKAPYGNEGGAFAADSPSTLLHVNNQGNIVSSETPINEKTLREQGDAAIASLVGQAGFIEVPIYDTRLAISFAAIKPTINIIRSGGYSAPGDGGDASYRRVMAEPVHAGKVQSADGAWWELSRGQIINPRMFGAVGDGITNDTAAVQAAIDFAAPFVWKGGTRATEEGSASGNLFIPKGTYRLTSKIRLAPNLRIFGEGCANDWTVRNGSTGGADKWGSALFVDYTNYQDYALDTSPYHADGIRHDNDTLEGADSFNGLKTEVHNIVLEDISIIGKYTTKGVNMAGAVFSKVSNVFLKGFTVGWRYSAVWYGIHENNRTWVSWKGLIAYHSTTDLILDGASYQKGYDAPAYNVGTMGSDTSLPPVGGWWLQAFNNVTVGITNFYSNITARNICVEGFQTYSAGRSAVNNFESVYIEGITYIAIISMGPDQSHEKHVFDTITTNSCDLIAQSQSRLEVGCLSTIGTQAGFNKLLFDVASDPINRPVIWGLKRNAGDIFPNKVMKRSDVYHTEGEWIPELKAGGSSLGTNSAASSTGNRFLRIGNKVTVWGIIQIPTKLGATGALTIDGLPYISRDGWGQFSSGIISFGYFAPVVGTPIVIESGKYEISIPNKTHADIQNNADLRFNITYETDAESLW